MRFYRSERVQSLIHDQLGKLIIREVEFNGAFVTIIGVDVDKKLESAKVRVSVIPVEKTEEVLKDLAREAGHLQYMLLRKINIKPMPRITFVADHGPENAAQVEKVFLEHADEVKGGDDEGSDEAEK